MPGFQRFTKYNNIDDHCIKTAVSNINLVRVVKGDYIFRQGSKTKEFFGIIKGQISIRIRKASYEETHKKFVKKKQIMKEMKILSKKEYLIQN